MITKKRPRDVDCDIVWYGARAAQRRARGAAAFVMQMCSARRAAASHALPAASDTIIVKNIHLFPLNTSLNTTLLHLNSFRLSFSS